MEKRKKLTESSTYVIDHVEDPLIDDPTRKNKNNASPTLVLLSIVLFIVVYYAYLTIQKPNKDLPSLTVHIPSFHEDINIHIPSIQKDALPIIEQIKLENQKLGDQTSMEDSKVKEMGLQQHVDRLLDEISKIKIKHVAIEDNPIGLQLKQELQDNLRRLIPLRYGSPPYLVEMKLRFPETMPDYATNGPYGTILIKLGPIELIPYSVYNFLEIVRHWKSGSFHRNAGHVLQSMISTTNDMKSLVFQEYHPDYPHTLLTMGYAGKLPRLVCGIRCLS
jgi:hypothetical protein